MILQKKMILAEEQKKDQYLMDAKARPDTDQCGNLSIMHQRSLTTVK